MRISQKRQKKCIKYQRKDLTIKLWVNEKPLFIERPFGLLGTWMPSPHQWVFRNSEQAGSSHHLFHHQFLEEVDPKALGHAQPFSTHQLSWAQTLGLLRSRTSSCYLAIHLTFPHKSHIQWEPWGQAWGKLSFCLPIFLTLVLLPVAPGQTSRFVGDIVKEPQGAGENWLFTS